MAKASGVLRVIVEAELSLGEPNVDEGLVTWFDVRVTAGEGADSAVIGNARVARIHVGAAANLNEPLYHVLDADSGELEALYDVFFEEDWFRDQFTTGAGSGLLFVSQLDLKPGWDGRNIDLALVRRLVQCQCPIYDCGSIAIARKQSGCVIGGPPRCDGRSLVRIRECGFRAICAQATSRR